MAYSADIGRGNPICLLFIIDQSNSMDERMDNGWTKAQCVVETINKTISTLVINCTKTDGVHDYVHVGVLGYGGKGAIPAFGGCLSGSIVHPISVVARTPLRVEVQSKREDDGVGRMSERLVEAPQWLEPVSSGAAPMVAALTKASEVVATWCETRPRSYPPTILHITNGASTDGNPEPIAATLRQISTVDGPSLFFNLHLSPLTERAIQLPDRESMVHDSVAHLLFRMSSTLPPQAVLVARDKGYETSENSRGFMFNAGSTDIANFIECVAPRFWMLRARMTPGHRLSGA